MVVMEKEVIPRPAPPLELQKPPEPEPRQPVMISVEDVDFSYSAHQVLYDVNLEIPSRAVTAFIGPSGCGKTTLLRCFNRMNDLIDGARITSGSIELDGYNINAPDVDVVDLRRRVGMVFQKSNQFTKMWPTVCAFWARPKTRPSTRRWKKVCAPPRFGTK